MFPDSALNDSSFRDSTFRDSTLNNSFDKSINVRHVSIVDLKRTCIAVPHHMLT